MSDCFVQWFMELRSRIFVLLHAVEELTAFKKRNLKLVVCYDLGKDYLLPYLNIMINMSLLKNLGFQENPSEDTA